MRPTATPVYDQLREETGYDPGAFQFRTHKQFMADHAAARKGKAVTPVPVKRNTKRKR
jgi:hypothetical protein